MITEAEPLNKNSDRRVCDRLEHNHVVVLKLGADHLISGLTRDISLGGICLFIEDDIEPEWLEQPAFIMIKDNNGNLSQELPCTIVRYEQGLVCMQLDKKTAVQFGTILTRGIFRKKIPADE